MSDGAYVLLGLLITAAVVGLAVRPGGRRSRVASCRRHHRVGADGRGLRRQARLLTWTQALPPLMTFWYPVLLPGQLDDEAVIDPETWEGCALVFVSEEQGSLTLDCVVPADGNAVDLVAPALVPVTVVVCAPSQGSNNGVADLRRWASAGTRVDIEFDGLGLVHVRRGAISATWAMAGERPSRRAPSSGV